MTIYAVLPLIATIAYIPLLFTTISSHPWRRQHILFILFLVAAMLWSLTDVFIRGNFFPQFNLFLFKVVLVTFTLTAVQLHCFTSSFFGPGQGRWLTVAYVALAGIITLLAVGYIPEGVTTIGDKVYPDYGTGIFFLAAPLLALAGRNFYVFQKRLKTLHNPLLHNQILSLVLSVAILSIFGLAALLPWAREFPISHFGNILIALILSYAVISHQLADIRVVLRQWLAWATLGAIGTLCYVLLLFIFHTVFNFELHLNITFAATLLAILVAILVYRLRTFLFITVNKAFQRQSYDDRQNLHDFANRIHSVFSLKEQGRELLTLAVRAIGCAKAGLLFFDADGENFTAQLVEPENNSNPLSGLRIKENNPIVEHLKKERQPLTSEDLAILPEFLSLWQAEKDEIESSGIELFMPLISRDSLIGILVLDKKQSGRYTLEDLNLLRDVTDQVAVSMEKEYLREQLRLREEELSVINRSSAIITSSLDIQVIYDSFIKELGKAVDVSWASISLIEENEAHLIALSSEIGSAWKVGERIPLKGTAVEWVANHKKSAVEPDLKLEIRFTTGKYHLQQGIRSIAYIPLIAKGEAIGCLIVASRNPHAYSQRHMNFLEQAASQIAMPIENSRLYAKTERLARIDELTGLLNRRSLNEAITSEISRHSRYGGLFSIIILDLDSFKAFNDNYGHLAGDRLLKQFGVILEDAIRASDQAFRYGGDEFAILLTQTPLKDASDVAERIRQQTAVKLKTCPIPVTISLGLASWPADGIGAIEILTAADAALYQAKRGGGNRINCASGTSLPPAETVASSGELQDSEALSAIYALAATVDARDHYTRNHSKKVGEYATALAEAINMEPLEINRLSTCALLHDIGKIGISDEILNKPEKLTAQEWEEIKTHPKLGAAIASHSRQLTPCIPGILHHHERYDGSGYPNGLKGEAIPLESRILALSDAFAAMTSERPYSAAIPYEDAIEEIRRGAGTQFDPKLVELFINVVQKMITSLPQAKK